MKKPEIQRYNLTDNSVNKIEKRFAEELLKREMMNVESWIIKTKHEGTELFVMNPELVIEKNQDKACLTNILEMSVILNKENAEDLADILRKRKDIKEDVKIEKLSITKKDINTIEINPKDIN